MYRLKGDFDRAIADFTRAVDINPQFHVRYFNRGYAHLLKGDFDRAIADYSKTVELNPQDYFAYYLRGVAHELKRDYDRAIADYTRAIEIDPTDAGYYSGRAWAFFKAGKAAQGLPDAERLPAIASQRCPHPGHPRPHLRGPGPARGVYRRLPEGTVDRPEPAAQQGCPEAARRGTLDPLSPQPVISAGACEP